MPTSSSALELRTKPLRPAFIEDADARQKSVEELLQDQDRRFISQIRSLKTYVRSKFSSASSVVEELDRQYTDWFSSVEGRLGDLKRVVHEEKKARKALEGLESAVADLRTAVDDGNQTRHEDHSHILAEMERFATEIARLFERFQEFEQSFGCPSQGPEEAAASSGGETLPPPSREYGYASDPRLADGDSPSTTLSLSVSQQVAAMGVSRQNGYLVGPAALVLTTPGQVVPRTPAPMGPSYFGLLDLRGFLVRFIVSNALKQWCADIGIKHPHRIAVPRHTSLAVFAVICFIIVWFLEPADAMPLNISISSGPVEWLANGLYVGEKYVIGIVSWVISSMVRTILTLTGAFIYSIYWVWIVFISCWP
ncbi:unnamed protein product [Peniophora sp. CBMAI 1063]|nr:unnamed protein product [Peniophora sp. CBMAI 1063]